MADCSVLAGVAGTLVMLPGKVPGCLPETAGALGVPAASALIPAAGAGDGAAAGLVLPPLACWKKHNIILSKAGKAMK